MKVEVQVLIDVDEQDYQRAYGRAWAEDPQAEDHVAEMVQGIVQTGLEFHDVYSVIGDASATVVA